VRWELPPRAPIGFNLTIHDTCFSIPVSSANPFTPNIEKAMAAAANKVRFKFTTWENQGQSSQWVQGMDTAVNQKST